MVWLAWNVLRLLAVVVVLFAIIIQSSVLSNASWSQDIPWDPSRYYAYFTIQSNLLGVVAVIWAFRRRNAPPLRTLDLFRGATIAYLIVTFAVSLLFLQDTAGLTVPWVEVVVHKLFPAFLVLDWLIDPPGTTLRWRDALLWLVYPIAWLAFTLVRGALDGWYPYPFLDPANGGYGAVAAMVVGITVGFGALAVVLIWIGNWRAGHGPRLRPGDELHDPRPAVPAEPPGWENPGGPGTPP